MIGKNIFSKKLFLSLLLLLSLSSLVFAAPKPWEEIFTTHATNIGSLVGLTLLAATGIIVIVWMFANLLNHEPLKAYAKLELFEIIYSAVLFLFIFSLFPTFDAVAASSVQPLFSDNTHAIVIANSLSDDSYAQLPRHFQYAKYFLSSVFNEAVLFNTEIFGEYSWTALLAHVTFQLDLFWEQRSFINYAPISGFFHLGNVIKTQIFDLVTKVALITKFQEIFLHVFIIGFFPTFLAAGIILRSFQLTRKLGGLLLAIVLSLYFIFPMAYLLGGAVYDSVGGVGSFKIDASAAAPLLNPLQGTTPLDDSSFSDLQNKYGSDISKIEQELKDSSKEDICAILSNIDEGGSTTESEAVQKSLEEWSDNFQKNSIDVLPADDEYFDIPARLIFFSMFFSFFGLMTTVATIRSLSGMFGGDLEIAGLTHLI